MRISRTLVREMVADLLGLPANAIAENTRFRDLGLSSAQVLTLVARIAEHTGEAVPSAAAWEHPTVAALADFLAGNESAPKVAPASRDSRPPRAQAQPIAIVGMGCRFPGGVKGPADLWRALVTGVDGVGEVPSTRWNADTWFDADAQSAGKMNTRWGGFLDDVTGFDAGFFGIAPREAHQMDPQQRLALEVSWEALEDAGIVPGSLEGSRTAVFMGAWSQDYAELGATDARGVEQHSATGWNNSIIPARIAYALGLRGPAMTINTACSSSLVALHLALSSLERGEAEVALVGGVNLLLSPHTTVQMTKFGGMSPTGRCRTFAADADGYVRGEGCGTVVLRPLTEALRAGDRIYAVIHGSAVNNDGASNGLTAPNPEAQREVLTEAWARAGVSPSDVAYVEAHGTGTPLGDPIEAEALGSVLGVDREQPLRIGSVKTQLGHLEGAAGVAGLMKTALALYHGELPANLHFSEPNPLIDFERLRLRVVRQRETFSGEGVRYAGVSSFGYGGTNAHVALGELPYARSHLWPLAGADRDALAARASRHAERLRERREAAVLRELAPDAGDGPLRAVVRGRDPEGLRVRLERLAAGEDGVRHSSPDSRPLITFAFSGHGSQWMGMGRELLATEPTFGRVLRDCDRHVQAEAGWSVIDVLCSDDPRLLQRTDFIQPALFAFQVALARMLQAWGVQPNVVVGESIGEVAAAVVAGAFCEQAGAKLIVRWSALMAAEASGRGAMLVAALDAEEARDWLAKMIASGIPQKDLSLSGMLAPRSVSFAGTLEAVEALERALGAERVGAHRVAIDYASHSTSVAPLGERLRSLLDDVKPGAALIPMWSTVFGRYIAGHELTGDYWWQNLQQPIGLQGAVEALCTEGATHFVNVAPHPVSLRSIEATLRAQPAPTAVALATCWRGESAWRGLEELVSELWCAGACVDWDAFRDSSSAQPSVDVPAPLLISAHTEAALRDQARRWHEWLEQHPDTPWQDVVRTAALHRSHLAVRAVVDADSVATAAAALKALAEAEPGSATPHRARVPRGSVFVFSGHGTHWQGMGRQLLAESPAFATAIDACDAALRPHTGWSVRAVLAGDFGHDVPPLDRLDVVQPALFAMGIALAATWRSLGIKPAAVVGHSVGEVPAAVVSGALSLEDGARLVAMRGRLIFGQPRPGAMLHVGLPSSKIVTRLAPWAGKLSVAAVNEPESAIVSGDMDAISELEQIFESEEIFCRRVNVAYAGHSPHMDPVLDPFRASLRGIEPRASNVPFYSTVTGTRLEGEALDAEYWCRNLRETVQFSQTLEALDAEGPWVYCEVGPHPVLATAIERVTSRGSSVISTMRRHGGGLRDMHLRLAEMHSAGHPVDWHSQLPPGGRAGLPSYAFQRESYWLPVRRGDAAGRRGGITSFDHPVLSSMTSIAGSDAFLFGGCIGLTSHPWLDDHTVFGHVVVPGTALLEMALAAARQVGNAAVDELTLASPLVIERGQEVRLQLCIERSDERGGRTFTIFGRSDDADEDQPWTQHASGTLWHTEDAHLSLLQPDTSPPDGSEAIDMANVYASLAALGYEYGAAFQGLRGIWKTGHEVHAHVSLPAPLAEKPNAFSLHPALLDASLHAVLHAALPMDGSESIWLPFTWAKARLHAVDATELRVRFQMSPHEGDMRNVSVTASDPSGRVVFEAQGLGFRRASSEQLSANEQPFTKDLYRVEWCPVQLPGTRPNCEVLGGSGKLARALGVAWHADLSDLRANLSSQRRPELLVVDTAEWPQERRSGRVPTRAGLAEEARQFTTETVGILQQLLTNPNLATTALLWVTSRAVGTDRDEKPLDMTRAPIWGLLRSARSENPDRPIRLLDLDTTPPDAELLRGLVAADVPELALRDTTPLIPRLTRASTASPVTPASLGGTTLITGGLGELGRSLALHLVTNHGARHLVLTSRQGMATRGAEELVSSLRQAGAETVEVQACDVAVRREIEELLTRIPADQPLSAVFHLAGVLDDSVAIALTPQQIDRALRPKVDGAWHLHMLTERMPLNAFVLFSSVAGILGLQGQANYAAANAFLDVLAATRRRLGLPATSLAWGLWEQQGIGMSAHLGEAEIARMSRQGVAALPLGAGLEALDAALSQDACHWVPARLDLAGLTRALPRGAASPPMFRALVRRMASAARAPDSSSAKPSAMIAALPTEERAQAVLAAVRDELAQVVGTVASSIPSDAPLQSLGLDSLMSVELKNRLAKRFEVVLPSTLAFDHPTPGAISNLLLDRLELEPAQEWDDEFVREKLSRISIRALRSHGLLSSLMAQPDETHEPIQTTVVPSIDVDAVEHDSLLDLMEDMLGVKHG